MGEGSKSGIFTFDGFRLEVGNLILYRHEENLRLAPKVVKTLAVLVEEAGNIVTKEDLINRVWDDSIVEGANLSQNLSKIRKTLGTKPDGSSYIETLRRRGYRFTADNLSQEPKGPLVETTPIAEVNASPRIEVEKRGNVVAFVDREEADASVDDDAPPVTAVAEPEQGRGEPRKTRWIIVGAAALVVLIGLGITVWFNSAPADQAVEEFTPEIETIPLTDGDYVSDATISLDGKYVAYHEIDGENAQILVRQAGQPKPVDVVPKAKRLVGQKSFTPDGQFLYYLSREAGADHSSIYRVPALGGEQTKIIETASSHATFSPDGKSIAFTTSQPDFQIVIAASDGTGQTTVYEAEPGTSIAPNPAWSPDGKSVAFGRINASGMPAGKCTIASLDIETKKVSSLSPDPWDTCYRMEWLRDGKGVFFVGTKLAESNTTRRDQIYYVSVADGKARRLTSDPSRKQSESLGVTENNEVFAVPFTRSSQIWAMDTKGSSKTASRITSGSSDGRSGLVPLKDGRIAFIARNGENLGISTIDADGSDRRQVLSDPLTIEDLHATTDGKYFFFAHENNDRQHLYRVGADGTNLKQITDGDSYQSDSTTSPDGKWIAFESAPNPGEGSRIWRASIEGGPPTQISDQLCAVPSYSPTGKFLACNWGPQLFVLSAEDGKVVKTFTATQVAILNVGVKWTPDEKNLVYIASQKVTTNLWVQPLDGKPVRQLTDFVDGDIYNFAFSSDGSKLYLARGYQVHDAILIKNFQ